MEVNLKPDNAAAMIALLLAACIPAFALGVENYDGPDAATIKAHLEKQGFSKWEGFTFEAVDRQRVSGLRAQDMYQSTMHLRPGSHDIAILYNSPRGFMRGFWTAEVLLHATLKAGGSYRLGGSRNGDRIKAWIEDLGTHEVVSTIVAASGPILRKDDEPTPKPNELTGSPNQ